MKALRKIAVFMLTVALAMAVLPTLTLAAGYDPAEYDPRDVAVINAIIY